MYKVIYNRVVKSFYADNQKPLHYSYGHSQIEWEYELYDNAYRKFFAMVSEDSEFCASIQYAAISLTIRIVDEKGDIQKTFSCSNI